MENYNFKALPIYFKKLDDDVIVPKYANENDAGMDLYSNENIIINPQQTIAIKTGLCVEIPVGFELQIRPRSGLSLNTKLRIANSPATIDSGFRGEIKVIVFNTSIDNDQKIYTLDSINKNGIYEIKKHERIAQLVLNKIEKIKFIEKTDLNQSARGEKGFGSSGIS